MESYEKEKWVHQHYENDLPVRNVLEVQESADQVAYSISKYIEGSQLFDLNSQQLLDIVPATMNVLADLEAIVVSDATGYGRYDRSGHATYPSWVDFIKAIYNEQIYNWSTLEQKGLDSEVVKAAISELQAHIGSVTLDKKKSTTRSF